MRRLALLAVAVLAAACTPTLRESDREAIAGRTFVVTGASSGFGRGVAERLGANGGNVVLAARRGSVLEEVAGVIRASGGQALVVPTDVADADAVERLAVAAERRFGRVDAWINNAGVITLGRFEEVPVADHARTVAVNLTGVVHGSHAAMRRFRAQGFGTLVNVSSVEGRVPLAYHAVYAATKHGVLGLTNAVREEVRLGGLSDRIRVVAILPWAADTPIWDNAGNYTGRSPRGPSLEPASPVAEAIVWATLHGDGEVPVGPQATFALLGSQVAPGLTNRIAANIQQRVQMENAPPAPPTAGNVLAPVPTGTTVEGTTRARMRREDAAR